MNLIVDMHQAVVIILFVLISSTLLFISIISLILGFKNLKKKKIISKILILLSLIPLYFMYELGIFGFYYMGQNYIRQKKYDSAIKTYEIGANYTLNPKQKALFWGEIGTTYLLMTKQGFNVIVAYNNAYIYSKSYKLMKNNEVWSPFIVKLFIKKNKNNISSKWPLLAAKIYSFENHFERSEKIYQTAKDKPILSGLVITAILNNNYNKALEYSNAAIIDKKNDHTLYAQRANIYKLLGDIERSKIDLEQAKRLCKNDSSCKLSVEKISKTYAFDIHQNYFTQRKVLGFENF